MGYQNVSAQQFAELKEKEDHVVIDVRSPQELSEGEVPGYTMINFFEPAFRTEIEN